MSLEKYIGIENEFISFDERNHQDSFGRYFRNFEKSLGKVFNRSSSAVRSDHGNAYYVDGDEIEICTPPVAINKGFASRLTDLLMIGRDKIIEGVPTLNHTGYSMHWNLTNDLTPTINEKFYKGIVIPFQMFGLTPLSHGCNLRFKDDDGFKRMELLGDSILNEKQINATALMLGSYVYAFKNSNKVPIYRKEVTIDRQPLIVADGRFSFVSVNNKNSGKIQVQKYLTEFFNWIAPYAQNLGTNEEFNNLKDFISGKKQLEIDKFKYFSYVRLSGGKLNNGIYMPFSFSTEKENKGQIIVKSEEKREVPLEGKLLGGVVTRHCKLGNSINIEKLTWNELKLKSSSTIEGTKNIYDFLSSYLNLPPIKYLSVEDIKNFDFDNNHKLNSSSAIKYDENNDTSFDIVKASTFTHEDFEKVKEETFKKEYKCTSKIMDYILTGSIGIVMGLLLSTLGEMVVTNFDEKSGIINSKNFLDTREYKIANTDSLKRDNDVYN